MARMAMATTTAAIPIQAKERFLARGARDAEADADCGAAGIGVGVSDWEGRTAGNDGGVCMATSLAVGSADATPER